MWESSNPALRNDDAFQQLKGVFAGDNVISLQGVVNKTGILLLLAVSAGAATYMLLPAAPQLLVMSNIAAFVVALGVSMAIYGKPARAIFLAPVYAAVEGAFLGALTAALDGLLASRGLAAAGGVALQAFIITISILLAMLGLYSAKILRPTKTFVSVIKVAVAGIMVTYLVSFAMSLFGTRLPFVSLGSALGGGTPALIGLGINVLFLGVASMSLIIDFKLVEELVARGGPKRMEWYGGFALMVTLAWIYFEAVKLVFRVAMILGDRR